jgi:hypothetical protein
MTRKFRSAEEKAAIVREIRENMAKLMLDDDDPAVLGFNNVLDEYSKSETGSFSGTITVMQRSAVIEYSLPTRRIQKQWVRFGRPAQ